jgi:hypothetical protein
MKITRICLERFTAFEELDFMPSPGVNVLAGANGTGKTHLMKVAYAACDVTKTRQPLGEKLVSAFLPSGGALGRLVKRRSESSTARVFVEWNHEQSVEMTFSNHIKEPTHAKVAVEWLPKGQRGDIEAVFIPVKEMLANAPGFRSLYARREVHFESVYADIIDRAYLPVLRGKRFGAQRSMLMDLQEVMAGKVLVKNEEFFLKNSSGELEFSLLAEGLRKLGLLWLLIQNGTLAAGSVLFWDEPEANLNPRLFRAVVRILLTLQEQGVQIFVSTHDYSVVKEFELAATEAHQVRYHVLYHDPVDQHVRMESSDEAFSLSHSPIAHAMSGLYDRQIRKVLGAER